jgi:hypothetical protein
VLFRSDIKRLYSQPWHIAYEVTLEYGFQSL